MNCIARIEGLCNLSSYQVSIDAESKVIVSMKSAKALFEGFIKHHLTQAKPLLIFFFYGTLLFLGIDWH